MITVARYFRHGVVLAFIILYSIFVWRLTISNDACASTKEGRTRRREVTRFPDLGNSTSGANTTTSVDNSRKCIGRWGEGNNTKWFNERFDHSLSPLWTKENINMPSEVFDWWNSLFKKPQTYENATSLVKQLALNTDLFLGNRSRDCITCAVVGNSGNVRKSGYGRMIDGHDIIIRMNECPTTSYENDVGSRTTHYIAYPQSFKGASLGNASLVLAAFCYSDMEWLHKKLVEQSKRTTHIGRTPPFDKNKIFILNPEVMWQIKHKWGIGRGRYPSTGMLSVFFALQICDEVNVFGFGATSKGNWDHYFAKDDGAKNSAFKRTHVHDGTAEDILLQKLVEAKKIFIYKGVR